jgi:transposase
MLSLPPAVRIYLCLEHADMRRGFDGLARMTLDVVQEDPFSGHLFVFRNRRGDRLKILYWDRDGFALWYKRLEKGTFPFPAPQAGGLSVGAAELALILEGIEVSGIKRQKRFEKQCA